MTKSSQLQITGERYEKRGVMKTFTINRELYGPIFCEESGCKKESDIILMTKDEYETSQNQKYPTNYIFRNKIGKVLCKTHLKSHNSGYQKSCQDYIEGMHCVSGEGIECSDCPKSPDWQGN